MSFLTNTLQVIFSRGYRRKPGAETFVQFCLRLPITVSIGPKQFLDTARSISSFTICPSLSKLSILVLVLLLKSLDTPDLNLESHLLSL